MARSRPYPTSCPEPVLLGDLLLWQDESFYREPSQYAGELAHTALQWVTLDGRWLVGKWVRCEHSAIDGRPFFYAVVFGSGPGGSRAGVERWAPRDQETVAWVESELAREGYCISPTPTGGSA